MKRTENWYGLLNRYGDLVLVRSDRIYVHVFNIGERCVPVRITFNDGRKPPRKRKKKARKA